MPNSLDKIHWQRLKEFIEHFKNGRVVLDFQDGLPVKIREIEGKDRDLDLTQAKTDTLT